MVKHDDFFKSKSDLNDILRSDFITKMLIKEAPHQIWDIGAHKIQIDPSILNLLDIAYLQLKELKKVALEIDKGISNMGYSIPARSVILCSISSIPNPEKFLARCQQVENNIIINIPPDMLSKENIKIKNNVANLETNERKEKLKDMLRAHWGVTIAHELTHSFGIDYENEKVKYLELKELELLTDSIALLSSLSAFGKSVYLGAAYIQKHLDLSISVEMPEERAIEIAKSTIKKYMASIA
jgi:hypothetical protein